MKELWKNFWTYVALTWQELKLDVATWYVSKQVAWNEALVEATQRAQRQAKMYNEDEVKKLVTDAYADAARKLRVIDPNAPCPGCGNRNGSVEFRPEYKGREMIHTCKVCSSHWSEPPVITHEEWKVTNIEEFVREERDREMEEKRLAAKAGK